MALCARVFCVLSLYLAHTCLNAGDLAVGVAAFSDGLSSAPSSDVSGCFVCGESCFDTDAFLPRERENDPFLIFLSLAEARPSPAGFSSAAARDRFSSSLVGLIRPPGAPQAQLLILAHASQVLC